MVHVRQAQTGEADALGAVMWDAVHNGPSLYTAAQRAAWVPRAPSGPTWAARLGDQQIWVAEEAGALLGFVTLGDGGYVDFAYVRGGAQRRGIFGALMTTLEGSARDQGARRLWTHASLMAQPAFAQAGFHVIRHQDIERRGEILSRAEMEKTLI
ncbi:GNAT family N-acetyltransferase [uncultured Tateyamaria sp.]|uniref:GNAT family N-acetyltransferase n=1 Tax=Tateyamaria sp. 1078 TaxID=3417464 RepID=UPI002639678B|nr:GNAT family N-acetyltransferase [uncultured Tateyamaria sp.]